MLIAQMYDTYNSVMTNQKEERLRAKCRLINENEFIFLRDRLFTNSRYLINASVDRAQQQASDDWEGQLNKIISTLNQRLDRDHEKANENFKGLRSHATELHE